MRVIARVVGIGLFLGEGFWTGMGQGRAVPPRHSLPSPLPSRERGFVVGHLPLREGLVLALCRRGRGDFRFARSHLVGFILHVGGLRFLVVIWV